MATVERNCTVLFDIEKASSVQQEVIIKDLESNNNDVKKKALRQAIMAILSGEQLPRVLMTVIRFCINTDDHDLKKLLVIFWEVVPKYDTEGKLLPEMILVCNALRNDLNHPNEFIAGSMLRFLCKLKEPEILEPLIPSIKSCLQHDHVFVRRNAALAVLNIYKSFGHQLIPDAPEVIEKFIHNEQDPSARRNAFLMLYNEAEEIAFQFLQERMDDVHKYGDGFALAVLELTRKVCRKDPNMKSRFVTIIFQMLNSTSAAVSYEAAWTLVSLSSAPTAIRAAASTYTTLLNKQSDNNIKLIVLERLDELKKYHLKVLQEVLMDILRALSSPNFEICKKVLDISMDLVGPRNIDEVLQVLNREVLKTNENSSDSSEKGAKYRQLLVQCIHRCAIKFPDVTGNVIPVLLDFIGGEGALDIVVFVQSIIQQYPKLREQVLQKLFFALDEIKDPGTMAVVLWLFGEFCETPELIKEGFEALKNSCGELPFSSDSKSDESKNKASETKSDDTTPTIVTKNVVLADGTYATQTFVNSPIIPIEKSIPSLRKMITSEDIFVGTVLVVTLTKFFLRLKGQYGLESDITKEFQIESLQIICGIARAAESKFRTKYCAFRDSLERISLCCRILLDPLIGDLLAKTFLSDCRETFVKYLEEVRDLQKINQNDSSSRIRAQADDQIHFRQLRPRGAQGVGDFDIYDGDDLSKAAGVSVSDELHSKFRHMHQLTGYADPVFAEAIVTVHDYDIVLEMTIINRTEFTLTNLTVELATIGDLKLVERPQNYTIGPFDKRKMTANIKVSSTETGHIFGTIVYENSSTAAKTYINLNSIQLDVIDYIHSATCSDEEFRSMWAEFEWENKVAINTTITELNEFLTHIIQHTNLNCLTPTSAFVGESNFLAANLYGKSVFGEDALVNVSVEKKDDVGGKLSGYIRIRSKTQGIALSLGDRIQTVQRNPTSIKVVK